MATKTPPRKLPRNKNLPEGISLLRQLNATANSSTLNLGLGKPEEDMPTVLRAMAEDTVRSAKLEYTENAGDLGIRSALSTKLALTSGKALILTHGAQEGLMSALMAILNKGDEVLVPDPGFLAYATMVKIQGGKAVPYVLSKRNGAFQHDLKEISKKISSRTRAIIVSSPGNPTGCDLTDEVFNELVKLAERKKILILSD
jgi:aspartate aminotransferase